MYLLILLRPGARVNCLLVAVAALLCSTIAIAECESPRPHVTNSSTMQVTKDIISWTQIWGASAYRVQLRSRVPNGRVLTQLDVVVSEPRFSSTRLSGDFRAKVSVRLSAICGSESSKEAMSWYVADNFRACRERTGDLRAYALIDGRQIATSEARGSAHIVAAMPECAGTRGEASYSVLAGG